MKAVVDASPLIYLCRIGRLDLLRQYREVLIPEAVMDEVEEGRARGHMEALDIRRLVRTRVARVVRAPRTKREWNVGPGEAAAISVALKERVRESVIDDRAAIAVAKFLGLRPVSVPFLLLRDRKAGKTSQKSFETDLRHLLSEGYYLSPELVERLIREGRVRTVPHVPQP